MMRYFSQKNALYNQSQLAQNLRGLREVVQVWIAIGDKQTPPRKLIVQLGKDVRQKRGDREELKHK